MATTTTCKRCGKETHFTRMSLIDFESICYSCREKEDADAKSEKEVREMAMKDWPEKIGEVVFKGMNISIHRENYKGGRVAIILMEGKMPFTVLSTNLSKEGLADGEFFVKNWSENEEIAPFILENTDLFEDTGIAVDTGFVQAPIWRFKREA